MCAYISVYRHLARDKAGILSLSSTLISRTDEPVITVLSQGDNLNPKPSTLKSKSETLNPKLSNLNETLITLLSQAVTSTGLSLYYMSLLQLFTTCLYYTCLLHFTRIGLALHQVS